METLQTALQWLTNLWVLVHGVHYVTEQNPSCVVCYQFAEDTKVKQKNTVTQIKLTRDQWVIKLTTLNSNIYLTNGSFVIQYFGL